PPPLPARCPGAARPAHRPGRGRWPLPPRPSPSWAPALPLPPARPRARPRGPPPPRPALATSSSFLFPRLFFSELHLARVVGALAAQDHLPPGDDLPAALDGEQVLLVHLQL